VKAEGQFIRKYQNMVMQELVNVEEDELRYNDKASFNAFVDMMRAEQPPVSVGKDLALTLHTFHSSSNWMLIPFSYILSPLPYISRLFPSLNAIKEIQHTGCSSPPLVGGWLGVLTNFFTKWPQKVS
jgi:hypothetical protein